MCLFACNVLLSPSRKKYYKNKNTKKDSGKGLPICLLSLLRLDSSTLILVLINLHESECSQSSRAVKGEGWGPLHQANPLFHH